MTHLLLAHLKNSAGHFLTEQYASDSSDPSWQCGIPSQLSSRGTHSGWGLAVVVVVEHWKSVGLAQSVWEEEEHFLPSDRRVLLDRQ